MPCEHRFGPAYILDEPDRVALATIITRYPQDGAVQVVGLYRSYTGRGAEPDEADRELMRMFFRSREFICLLLQPFSSESCMAGFRFWNDGEMRVQQNGGMFPFDAAQMGQQEVTAMPPMIVSPGQNHCFGRTSGKRCFGDGADAIEARAPTADTLGESFVAGSECGECNLATTSGV